jgi:hypothetical protein
MKAVVQGLVKLPVGIEIWFLRSLHNAVRNNQLFVGLLFEQSCHKADYKRQIVRKWRLRPKQ